jgi:hypothetical protein
MITTSSTMRNSLLGRIWKTRIIGSLQRRWVRKCCLAVTGVCILWLCGCSSLGLGYSNGPTLVTWWLDRQLDLNAEQSAKVRLALDQGFGWHRSQRLAQELALLARFEREVQGEVTPAQVCAWVPIAQTWADTLLAQLAPAIVEIAPTLQAQQLAHLEARMARSNEDWRRDHLQTDPQERLQAQLDRLVTNLETLYGRLERPQKDALQASLARSSWDPDQALVQRKRNQQDTLSVLRQLNQGRGLPTAEAAQTLVRAWLVRQTTPSDEATRRSRAAFVTERCQLVADFHHSATPEQRRHAGETLAGWQDDLRGFVVASAPAAGLNAVRLLPPAGSKAPVTP